MTEWKQYKKLNIKICETEVDCRAHRLISHPYHTPSISTKANLANVLYVKQITLFKSERIQSNQTFSF